MTNDAPGLTASFDDVPAAHDGENAFTFELRFSDNFPGRLSFKLLRDEALQVTNGRVTGVKRVTPGQNQRWTITVEPASSRGRDGDAAGGDGVRGRRARCAPRPGRNSSNTVKVVVPGPAMLSAEDAAVRERANAAVAFWVMLSRPPIREVTVDYTTADGTAKAGK